MMRRTFGIGALTMFAVMASASLAAAAEMMAAAPGPAVDYTKAIVIGCSLLVAGLAMALGTIGTGLGMGNGLSSAVNAVGRNPEAQGKVLITMMVGLAMIESLAIYALVIALVVLYANPLLKYIGLS
jgi:F-type H+-transporting ATPase subunit c